MGPPAAGKSQYADRIVSQLRPVLIDSDEAKKHIPEYEGGRFASVVHEESDLIKDIVLFRAISNGDNIVIPIVGRNLKKVEDLGDRLTRLGYSVRLVLIHADANTVAERVVRRLEKTGRFVDPEYALEIGDKPYNSYRIVKTQQLWSECVAYRTDAGSDGYVELN